MEIYKGYQLLEMGNVVFIFHFQEHTKYPLRYRQPYHLSQVRFVYGEIVMNFILIRTTDVALQHV